MRDKTGSLLHGDEFDGPGPSGSSGLGGAPMPAALDGDDDDADVGDDGDDDASDKGSSKVYGVSGPREEWVQVATVYDGETFLGIIKYSSKFQNLSAWCMWRDPSAPPGTTYKAKWGTNGICRCDRTVEDKGAGYRGRPVGLLIVWLKTGPHPSRTHEQKPSQRRYYDFERGARS